MSFSKTTRRIGFLLLALPVIWFASFVAFMNLGENIRMRAFANLADRSTELVQAIERYTDQHAEPPGELSDLVPVFVSEIPKTGMAAYPEYEYYVGEDANRYDGNPWVLLVSTPLWGINWDQFMYFPLRNYPEKGYGGVLERLGSWAYVHE